MGIRIISILHNKYVCVYLLYLLMNIINIEMVFEICLDEGRRSDV